MSPTSPDALSNTFAALADPTRRAILARLAQGETSVGDLVKPFAISGPAISRHLRVLENACLIERRVDAQRRICRLSAPGLRVADDWLAHYRTLWDNSLDQLVEVLERDAGTAEFPVATVSTDPDPPPAAPVAQTPKPRTPSGARRAPSNRKRNSP